jgi:hypothetical protein
VVELHSGEDGGPVDGSLLVSGASFPAWTPLSTAVPAGATVEVNRSGFLHRETTVRTGETLLWLWPITNRLPPEITRAVIYGDGSAPLRRLPSRVKTVGLAVPSYIVSDPGAMEALQGAVDQITRLTAPAGTQYVVTGAGGDFTIPLSIEPANASCTEYVWAFAELWLDSSNEISRARIVYCNTEASRWQGVTSHELGPPGACGTTPTGIP